MKTEQYYTTLIYQSIVIIAYLIVIGLHLYVIVNYNRNCPKETIQIIESKNYGKRQDFRDFVKEKRGIN